jgi:hypothetical protein
MTDFQGIPLFTFEGIPLFTEFEQGSGIPVERLPTSHGVYAEIHWPRRGLRFGETKNSIRGRIRENIRWFNAMHDGTAPPEQLRRTIPIAQAARATGAVGFEFYVVSVDPRLQDERLRYETERFLFRWTWPGAAGFLNWNHQRSWTNRQR